MAETCLKVFPVLKSMSHEGVPCLATRKVSARLAKYCIPEAAVFYALKLIVDNSSITANRLTQMSIKFTKHIQKNHILLL